MSTSIQCVLAATDFSDVSLNAVHTAAAICKRHGARLRLLYVVTHFEVAVPPLGHYAMVGKQLAEMQHTESHALAKLAADISEKFGIVCTGDEAMGPVDEAVANYASEHSCDLIVMGSVGATGIGKYFLGSNAIATLKRAPCPVLAVPEGVKAEEFRNILFPIRDVPNATEKYDFLRPVIAKNGATLHVAGVAELGNPDRFLYVNALTAELAARLKEDGVSFTLEKHYCPNVMDTVLMLADKREVDLLVITSTLEKDFWQLLTGTFSKQLLDRATTAVLMVRPGKHSGQETPDILKEQQAAASDSSEHVAPQPFDSQNIPHIS